MRVGVGVAGATVITAALRAGTQLLDTAEAYHEDGGKPGDNERAVAAALGRWQGNRESVVVATKGGMTRRGRRWIPDGRAKSLRSSCERSLESLGMPAHDLYLLHAPDPKVAIETSVRALSEIRKAGLATRIGVCNVNHEQLERAIAVAEIDAVEVAINPFQLDSIEGGVVEFCRDHSIDVIVHSPLGGPKQAKRLAKHAALAEVAEKLGITAIELALAWIASLDAPVVAIPSTSRFDNAATLISGQSLVLDPAIRAEIGKALEVDDLLSTPRAERRARSARNGDVVIIMGSPGSGKSTAARELTERGYLRLNRDKRGGTLSSLIAPLREALASGRRNVVLDNTYASRAARNRIIETAWRGGASCRCVWIDTSLEDAQINAVTRMIRAHGTLPTPEEIESLGRKAAIFLPPSALFRFRRELEPPRQDEGFESLDRLPFDRQRPASHTGRALVVEVDGVLRTTKSGGPRPLHVSDLDVLPGRRETLRRYANEGWIISAISWQPEIGSGKLDRAVADACFVATFERLGIKTSVSVCPHVAGPPKCWCRKPLPGLGVELIERHSIDVSRSLMVGRNSTDELFANRLGFDYRDADSFF